MVKAEVTETFTLKEYDKVKAVQKKSDKPHEFTKGDIFICDDEMATYLSGKNPLKKKVINVFEIIPEETKEPEKPKKIVEAKKKKPAKNITKE